MTAYGLLTYTLFGDVASALPVVKWLSQQRNSLGGFSSTQVAVVVRLQPSQPFTCLYVIYIYKLKRNFILSSFLPRTRAWPCRRCQNTPSCLTWEG